MKTLKYIAAHVLWLVNALFGLWLLFISRNTWLAAFSHYYVLGSPTRANRANLMDRLFSILLGLLWFGMVIAIEPYFNGGVRKGNLLRRFSKATGPIVLAFFVIDLILAVMQGAAGVSWLRLVVFMLELVLGLALIRLGWFKPNLPKPAGQAGSLN